MHCKDEEQCRVVVERVRLRTTLEPDPTSCVASLTPVVARFIGHLTIILSDKSTDYSSILSDKSADYHDTRSVVARFIEHHPDESGIYNEALAVGRHSIDNTTIRR